MVPVFLWLTLINSFPTRFRIVLSSFRRLKHGEAYTGIRCSASGSQSTCGRFTAHQQRNGHRFLEMVVSTPSHATRANESKAKSVFRVVSGNFLEMYDFMDVTFSALKQKPPRHGYLG